jgi:hypothetical protein
MAIDPYSSPSSGNPPPVYTSDALVTQGVLQQLAGTKPWVRFISVMTFVGAGLMLLLAVGMLVAGGAMAASGKSGGLPAGTLAGIAVFYALLGMVYIYPAMKLWSFASKIGALLISGRSMDLEAALSQQRSFWKFIGIMMITLFALYAVFFIGMMVVGGFAAMKAKGL